MISETPTYNGWKNRETWNVAMTINNDKSLYSAAVEWMRTVNRLPDVPGQPGREAPYVWFINLLDLMDDKTPDGVEWISEDLDYEALNEMMWELIK